MSARRRTSSRADDWFAANQQYLVAALQPIRAGLLKRSGVSSETIPDPESMRRAIKSAAKRLRASSALQRICEGFKLSPFERDLLLLCAGCELDGHFAKLCATAHGDEGRTFATFGLGLGVLENSHWSAVTPESPLRRWRLIDVNAGEHLMASRLRIDERILHFLAGVSTPDIRLRGLLETALPTVCLPELHLDRARQLAIVWQQFQSTAEFPAIHLATDDRIGASAIAAAAAVILDLQLKILRAKEIPASASERESLARLLERESVLDRFALLIDIEDRSPEDVARAAYSLLDLSRSPMIICGAEPVRLPTRLLARIDVPPPSPAEQQALWREALGAAAADSLNGHVELVSTQFQMSPATIAAAGARVAQRHAAGGECNLGTQLWDECRVHSRPKLDNLARRINPLAKWDDLVIPGPQLQILRSIAVHVRQRSRVYQDWGFAARSERGLGVSALFTGGSGTGKTMAAEVLSNELRLDLYRIDLSALVSKYIGETEKNLRQLFDAAECGGAILLFDEADAIFGRRSEVRDSHDRYANIEVGYLLQRVETYRGLVILTTNQPQSLDPAFSRRLRFNIQFPFPDVGQRAEIWRRIFPAATPVQGLQAEKLARLNLAGGHIRNVALNAAFLAADAAEPVQMKHLLAAAQTEFTKLEKTLSAAETAGWV